MQLVLAAIAFPVWVFAVGGAPVASWDWFAHNSYVGSLALMFVTIAFGAIKPS